MVAQVSSTNKIESHDITEISLKVALSTITLTLTLLTEEKGTYEVGNPGPGLGQAHKCDGIKPVNENPTLPIVQIGLAKERSIFNTWC